MSLNINESILYVDELNIKYNNKVIVKDGTFYVKPGELVLIVGENGSGKSSIFRSLINENFNIRKKIFRKQKTKSIMDRKLYFNGQLVKDNNIDSFRQSIGYARQEDDNDPLFSRKIWDIVLNYASFANTWNKNDNVEEKCVEVYNKLHCEKYADGNLKKLRINNCSGGEKRMATILSAFSRQNSKLFILDEPINNLDGYHAKILNNYIIDLKKSKNPPGILIITHCHMFQNVDRAYKLSNGKLVEMEKYEANSGSCFGCFDCFGKYLIKEEE